jgi:hypothetical protein
MGLAVLERLQIGARCSGEVVGSVNNDQSAVFMRCGLPVGRNRADMEWSITFGMGNQGGELCVVGGYGMRGDIMLERDGAGGVCQAPLR